MNATEWKTKLNAVHRAAYAGDDEPLNIVCRQLEDLFFKANPKVESIEPKIDLTSEHVIDTPEPEPVIDMPEIKETEND